MALIVLGLLARCGSRSSYGTAGSVDSGHPDRMPPRESEVGVTVAEFNHHSWIMTVNSVENFPVTCCLFGQQFINYMETAWLVSRVLNRGLIEPSFIFQARNDSVYERMKASGGFRDDKFHAILGTVPVTGGKLFDLGELAANDERELEISAFATNDTFWTATGGTIDLLVVGEAAVIGGQACANASTCSVHRCPTLESDPGPLPRLMEFFGRMHLVKKVACIPRTERHLRGQIYDLALDQANPVVALALASRHINAFAGGSTSGFQFPIATHSAAVAGQELWSVDPALENDWLSILDRFAPSQVVRCAVSVPASPSLPPSLPLLLRMGVRQNLRLGRW